MYNIEREKSFMITQLEKKLQDIDIVIKLLEREKLDANLSACENKLEQLSKTIEDYFESFFCHDNLFKSIVLSFKFKNKMHKFHSLEASKHRLSESINIMKLKRRKLNKVLSLYDKRLIDKAISDINDYNLFSAKAKYNSILIDINNIENITCDTDFAEYFGLSIEDFYTMVDLAQDRGISKNLIREGEIK